MIRSYKNGYVWHDLTEEDFIHPVHGNEYVLKGTELLNLGPAASCSENSVGTSSSTSSTGKILETSKSSRDDSDFSAPSIRSSQKKIWGSLELKEYNAYRAELMESDNKTVNNFSNVRSADASTQTDERRYRRREIAHPHPPSNLTVGNKTIELTRDEISPPPTSSPDTLETLVKCNSRILEDQYLMAGNIRGKTSAVLMHLISCGSIAVKGQSVVVVPHHGARLTRGSHSQIGGSCRFSGNGKVVVEKEYFSGSLLEAKGDAEINAVLKRCSSYNAER